jgi:hypothetical protein
MLTIVLLAASVGSGASVPVTHFKVNGNFADVFFACDDNGLCASVSVFQGVNLFQGKTAHAPQTTMLFYTLFLLNGDQQVGFGLIPDANVTVNDTRSLILADTDTNTIDGFTNLLCDINFNCSTVAGGVISGTWQKLPDFSVHSTSSSIERIGHILFTFNGTFDESAATAQVSVLGNNFSNAAGDIGTQHNSGITINGP